MFRSFGLPEIIILLVIVLILFGPGRIGIRKHERQKPGGSGRFCRNLRSS